MNDTIIERRLGIKGLVEGTLALVSVVAVFTSCASGGKGLLLVDSFRFSALPNAASHGDLTEAINVTVEPEPVLLSHPDYIASAK